MNLKEVNLVPRRVYATRTDDATGEVTALTLSDAEVVLDPKGHAAWSAIAESLWGGRPCSELPRVLSRPEHQVATLLHRFEKAGLLVEPAGDRLICGEEFYAEHFEPALPSWLGEAFSHPFWDRMTSGRGSKRLFTGWLIELYHYTRNANRHMPLSCAHTREKPLKLLRAKHYAEEWNHYHYFTKALKALGYTDDTVVTSVPLADDPGPVQLHAPGGARGHPRLLHLLGGAGGDHHRSADLQPVLREVRRALRAAPRGHPAHLRPPRPRRAVPALGPVPATSWRRCPPCPAARAGRVLEYGHQLAEHIWLWTDDIEKYYSDEANPVPRRPFDPQLD